MIAEVGAEHNTATIVLMPSDFVNLAQEQSSVFRAKSREAAGG